MKKSVFTRYMKAFTAIILITFTILGLIIGSNLAYSSVADKRKMAAQTSATAAGVIQSVIARSRLRERQMPFLIRIFPWLNTLR